MTGLADVLHCSGMNSRSGIHPTLAEERAAIEADLNAASEERKHLDWLRSWSPSRGDDEPERQQQSLALDARITSLENRLAAVVRDEQRIAADTARLDAAGRAAVEAKWRASLPEPERVIHDRLDAVERRLDAIVRALHATGYRSVE